MSEELSGCTSPSSWVFRKLKWKCGSKTEELGGENKCSALQWHHPSNKSANEVVLFIVESNHFVCCVTKVTPESDQRYIKDTWYPKKKSRLRVALHSILYKTVSVVVVFFFAWPRLGLNILIFLTIIGWNHSSSSVLFLNYSSLTFFRFRMY